MKNELTLTEYKYIQNEDSQKGFNFLMEKIIELRKQRKLDSQKKKDLTKEPQAVYKEYQKDYQPIFCDNFIGWYGGIK